MYLKEVLEAYTSADRIRIYENGNKEPLYTGWLGMLMHIQEADGYDLRSINLTGMERVTKLRTVPEIRHKQWRELGLMQPIEPDITPQYSFSDLTMQQYYDIYIERNLTKV